MSVDIEKEAIELVKNEKRDWEQSYAFITETIAFDMRQLIKDLRKNYWGIFNTPKDPNTGKDKVWVPLTESLVEGVVKNIDLDTNDLNVKAKNRKKTKLATLVREKLKYQLEENDFGERLNELERQLAIDGTVVWKIIPINKNGKKTFEIRNVDLLNFYIDPTVRSIKEAEAVIERAVMTPREIRSMDGWMNTEEVEGVEGLSRTDGEIGVGQVSVNQQGGIKLVEVFERWGLMPKRLITGKEDDDEMVNGRVIVSGISNEKGARVHLIEEIGDKEKPYEEAFYTRVSGRWYGRGVAEKVQMLQVWINTIVNIRINRSYVSQLGLFKIKKNRGITPQMISRLSANGAILVNDQDDIQQMTMQEASQASYNDENVIQGWAERVTSAFEMVTGENVAATTTATVGAIQSRSAQSQFTLIKEGISHFLNRVFNKHIIKIVGKGLKKGDLLRISLSGQEAIKFNEQLAESLAAKKVSESGGNFEEERLKILKRLNDTDNDSFFKISEDVDFTEYDVNIYTTNEEIDKNILVTNLINMLNVAPEFRQPIIEKVFDMLGLDFREIEQRAPQSAQALQQVQQTQPNQTAEQPQSEQQASLQALTGAVTAQGEQAPQV